MISVVVPVRDEEHTVAELHEQLAAALEGRGDPWEVVFVDDGSRDGTADVARRCGVDHIVRLTRNKGLAAAFMAGIDASLRQGADFIVNTDADNQYAGHQIPMLIAPLLDGSADIVIGDRNIAEAEHMGWRKRQLQRLGSWVVRQVSNTSVPDTTSGFRAYTREAALRMTIVSEFSYTLESIIQAGKKRMAIAHVPVQTNARTRDSRLFDSVFSYIKKSGATIVRIYTMYEPLKVFTYIGLLVCSGGVALGIRFLYYFFFVDRGIGHIQSLILAAVLMILGFQVVLIGLLADVISANRKLLEEVVYRVRTLEMPLLKRGAATESEPPRALQAAAPDRRWDG